MPEGYRSATDDDGEWIPLGVTQEGFQWTEEVEEEPENDWIRDHPYVRRVVRPMQTVRLPEEDQE